MSSSRACVPFGQFIGLLSGSKGNASAIAARWEGSSCVKRAQPPLVKWLIAPTTKRQRPRHAKKGDAAPRVLRFCNAQQEAVPGARHVLVAKAKADDPFGKTRGAWTLPFEFKETRRNRSMGLRSFRRLASAAARDGVDGTFLASQSVPHGYRSQ